MKQYDRTTRQKISKDVLYVLISLETYTTEHLTLHTISQRDLLTPIEHSTKQKQNAHSSQVHVEHSQK